MEEDDQFLIKEYISGNQEAFKKLIDKYTPSIYNYSVRFVGIENTQDVVQDVFIKAWKNIKKFNIKKAGFKTWLFTITRNTITDYLRKKKMIPFSKLDKDEDESYDTKIEDEVILPDEALIQLEDKEFLNDIINQIPAHYREVLILHYQEDMTFKEIGEVLHKPLNTVKSYHQRALILLREKIIGRPGY